MFAGKTCPPQGLSVDRNLAAALGIYLEHLAEFWCPWPTRDSGKVKDNTDQCFLVHTHKRNGNLWRVQAGHLLQNWF